MNPVKPIIAEPVRQIIVTIPQASLVEYLVGQRVLINVPPDAKLIGAWSDSRYVDGVEGSRVLRLRVEHDSFAGVEAGRKIPRLRAIYRRPALAVPRRPPVRAEVLRPAQKGSHA